MKEHTAPESFENLNIPHKAIPNLSKTQYRVYKSAADFVVAEAENAQDAIKASNVENPLKVVRHDPTRDNVLGFVAAAEPAAAAPEAAQAAEAASPAPSTPATNEAAAAEAALSGEEVEKLLQAKDSPSAA